MKYVLFILIAFLCSDFVQAQAQEQEQESTPVLYGYFPAQEFDFSHVSTFEMSFDHLVIKPTYPLSNLVPQVAFGGLVGVGTGFVGAFAGAAILSPSGFYGALFGYLGGSAIGYVIGRTLVIHKLGNTKKFKGSYFLTLLSYSTVALGTARIMAKLSYEINDGYGWLLIPDVVGTITASYVHYLTLKPRSSSITTISLAPTLLQSDSQTFHGGLKLAVVF